MTQDELKALINNPHSVERHHLAELQELARKYPYSAPLHTLILVLLHKVNDLRLAGELSERALLLPDLRHLFYLLHTTETQEPATLTTRTTENEGREEAKEGKEEEAEKAKEDTSGFDLIDNFLEEYPDDLSSVESLLGTPSEETSESEPRQETSPTSSTPDKEATVPHSDELFTETLARMYIKQGKYERAKQILGQINLEFPQKSGYFAEQLNFLEKLITINSNKEK